MFKFALFLFSLGLAVEGEEFSLQIASAIAGQTMHVKSAAFVFRALGCPQSAMLEVTGTVEGLVFGRRRTLPLVTSATSTNGVFAVNRQWPEDGVWIINLAAKCSPHTAGALVVPGERGPNREASKFLPKAATEAEIDKLLRGLPQK